MRILWTLTAWQQYVSWQQSDPTITAKINSFIEDIRRDPVGKGTGQPEFLKGPLHGFISRRITREHRLVYRVWGKGAEQTIEIILCRGHY